MVYSLISHKEKKFHQPETMALWLRMKELGGRHNRVEILKDSWEFLSVLPGPRMASVEMQGLLNDILININAFDYFCISKVSRSIVTRAHNLDVKERKRD